MKRYPKNVALGFEEIIQNDFNPDIVKVFGIESYEFGLKVGILSSAIVFGAIYLAKRIEEKSKNSKTEP